MIFRMFFSKYLLSNFFSIFNFLFLKLPLKQIAVLMSTILAFTLLHYKLQIIKLANRPYLVLYIGILHYYGDLWTLLYFCCFHEYTVLYKQIVGMNLTHACVVTDHTFNLTACNKILIFLQKLVLWLLVTINHSPLCVLVVCVCLLEVEWLIASFAYRLDSGWTHTHGNISCQNTLLQSMLSVFYCWA